MPSKHVNIIKKKGRTFHYFRPPAGWLKVKGCRLSDDYSKAVQQADALMVLRAPCGETHAVKVKTVKVILNNSRGRAKARGLNFNLTLLDVYEMLDRQRWRCAVSGLPFKTAQQKNKSDPRSAFTPSIDRINNLKGYSVNNCRLVLSAINYGMNEWGEDQYYSIALAVVAYAAQRKTITASKRLRFRLQTENGGQENVSETP